MTPDLNGPRRIRVALLFGGQSAEHDVSLRSGQTVMGAFDDQRYEVIPIGITRHGRWVSGGDPMAALAAASPMFHLGEGEQASGVSLDEEETSALAAASGSDTSLAIPSSMTQDVDVVFPALHGPMGEDGTLQGMLELAGIPYIGAGVLGSSVAMDKAMTKTVLTQAGLPQLPWRMVLRRDWERDASAITEWITGAIGYPCFIKPANLGSSVGISKVTSPAELPAAMEIAGRHDRKIVIERGVNAREIEMAILGNDDPVASVAGEIVPREGFYDYNAKYIDDSAELIVPAEIDRDLLGYLQGLAIDTFRALDLAGMARVDFFVERDTDRVYINEVNTLPGFTSISMYPMLWEASGVPLAELVDRLVQLALERHADRHLSGVQQL